LRIWRAQYIVNIDMKNKLQFRHTFELKQCLHFNIMGKSAAHLSSVTFSSDHFLLFTRKSRENALNLQHKTWKNYKIILWVRKCMTGITLCNKYFTSNGAASSRHLALLLKHCDVGHEQGLGDKMVKEATARGCTI
jgi:hypothetical protein